ncbi:unnamed protein product [Cuscuta europaea]|uniref:Transposase (putative) gypsy type domain-containing protein n=1 Tax=Cuscuta europaea TaxID=41803 RepID=A0A9P0YQZ2_CUSEU|nr:unnamed protein product [Cuscuta europaea]
MACSMEISSSSETSSGSSTGSSAGSSSASELRSRSSAEASGSGRSSASSMAVPDVVIDVAIPVAGEQVDMAVDPENTVAMAAQPAAAAGHPADHDSGEEAEEGDDLRIYKRGIHMDDHRHIVLIPNVAVIEQVFSKRALRELQVILPPPAYYSLRSADDLFMRRPGMVMVHLDSLKTGLRFPLHPFYLDFFEFYSVVPAQFMPNSYRQISAFFVLCKSLGLAFSLELFHYFFQVTPKMLMGS